jgi:hypothetical protein
MAPQLPKEPLTQKFNYAEILELSLQDTMAYYGFDKKTFRFQHDYARPHTSGATKK